MASSWVSLGTVLVLCASCVGGVALTGSGGSHIGVARAACRARAVRAQLEGLEEEDKRPHWQSPPPEGIPEQALADRSGPFWTTLGEPDEQTGERPNFLRRDDWHISSTYTDEVRAAMAAREEQEVLYAKERGTGQEVSFEIELPDEGGGYMEVEEADVDPDRERPVARVPMPTSWQEYQQLVKQVEDVQSAASPSTDEHTDAARHLEGLEEFYESFKRILAEGWTLSYDPRIDAAGHFLLTSKKKNKKTTTMKARA